MSTDKARLKEEISREINLPVEVNIVGNFAEIRIDPSHVQLSYSYSRGKVRVSIRKSEIVEKIGRITKKYGYIPVFVIS